MKPPLALTSPWIAAIPYPVDPVRPGLYLPC